MTTSNNFNGRELLLDYVFMQIALTRKVNSQQTRLDCAKPVRQRSLLRPAFKWNYYLFQLNGMTTNTLPGYISLAYSRSHSLALSPLLVSLLTLYSLILSLSNYETLKLALLAAFLASFRHKNSSAALHPAKQAGAYQPKRTSKTLASSLQLLICLSG